MEQRRRDEDLERHPTPGEMPSDQDVQAERQQEGLEAEREEADIEAHRRELADREPDDDRADGVADV